MFFSESLCHVSFDCASSDSLQTTSGTCMAFWESFFKKQTQVKRKDWELSIHRREGMKIYVINLINIIYGVVNFSIVSPTALDSLKLFLFGFFLVSIYRRPPDPNNHPPPSPLNPSCSHLQFSVCLIFVSLLSFGLSAGFLSACGAIRPDCYYVLLSLISLSS